MRSVQFWTPGGARDSCSISLIGRVMGHMNVLGHVHAPRLIRTLHLQQPHKPGPDPSTGSKRGGDVRNRPGRLSKTLSISVISTCCQTWSPSWRLLFARFRNRSLDSKNSYLWSIYWNAYSCLFSNHVYLILVNNNYETLFLNNGFLGVYLATDCGTCGTWDHHMANLPHAVTTID